MHDIVKDKTPRTLKQYNSSVKIIDDLLTGKEFRRLSRKKQRNK